VPYREAWALQKDLVSERAAGGIPDTLLLLEHPPTITLGRGTRAGDLRLSPDALAALGAECIEIERGGRATYHGPGQLVGYPIVSLREAGLGPVTFLRRLESTLVAALGALGVEAACERGHTGVWIGRDKVAAIGIAVSRGVTYHGFALNVHGSLQGFEWIVPCGIDAALRGVTSLERALGRPIALEEVSPLVARRVAAALVGVPA
jgi:lipoyl(octanoyl) transferase